MFWFVIELLYVLQGYSENFKDQSEILVGNSLFVFEWTVRILVSVSSKNKYSILKYISSFG